MKFYLEFKSLSQVGEEKYAAFFFLLLYLKSSFLNSSLTYRALFQSSL